MNLRQFIPTFMCGILAYNALSQTADIDKELSTLADKLAIQIKDQGKKKVAVIDFTDLQGNPNGELGKYIAEELTVNLVMIKKEFSVLDRANLRRLLAEHKLTSQGLIDPENAKKIGMFAGVDALILGTIIPKNKNISLNAKIITTDTAEIVGASKAEFKLDDMVQQLIATAPKPDNLTGSSSDTSPAVPAKKPFGDLEVKVASLKRLPDEPGGRYGNVNLTLVITNTSESKTYGVALENDTYYRFILVNNRGEQFKTARINGIEKGTMSGGEFNGSMTDILPRSSITFVAPGAAEWIGKPGDYRPYNLQALIMFGVENNGLYQDVRKFNLVMDIK